MQQIIVEIIVNRSCYDRILLLGQPYKIILEEYQQYK